MRLRTALIVVVVAVGSPACSKKPDAETLQKQLVGVWSFNPREQMPTEKIDDKAFITPDQTILQFEPVKTEEKGATSGRYTQYSHVPKHENDVAGRVVVTDAHWELDRRGDWLINAEGELYLQGGTENVKGSSDVHLKIVDSRSDLLRLDGFPLWPCKVGEKVGCVLRPLKELPTPAASATW